MHEVIAWAVAKVIKSSSLINVRVFRARTLGCDMPKVLAGYVRNVPGRTLTWDNLELREGAVWRLPFMLSLKRPQHIPPINRRLDMSPGRQCGRCLVVSITLLKKLDFVESTNLKPHQAAPDVCGFIHRHPFFRRITGPCNWRSQP